MLSEVRGLYKDKAGLDIRGRLFKCIEYCFYTLRRALID
jgi:hypothetical protein